jgi:hypothetical protein
MTAIPTIDLQWECAACRCDEKSLRSCTIIGRAGAELDVPLCEKCHIEPNIEIAQKGTRFEHQDGEPTYLMGDATLSDDLQYRYHLTRQWLAPFWRRAQGPVLWLLLNPSTADAQKPDPTIHRIIGFTHRLRFAQLEVANLFGYRTPHPDVLPRNIAQAVGVDNDRYIYEAMKRAELVIAGWGKPGRVDLVRMVDDRVAQVRALAAAANKEIYVLATTGDGSPKHPSARGTHRIPDETRPVPWEVKRG